MSLDFELGQIENWKETCLNEDGSINGVTDCLIWATIFVGISKIDDPKTFYARLSIWEGTLGPISSRGTPISLEEVVAHVGLITNASRKTDSEFLKNVMRGAKEEAARKLEYLALQDEEEEA